MHKYLAAALLCLLPTLGFAQDKPRAILVLDASGSMWGQIDGKAKITIAQDVIGELLQSLPVDQELGLTVYGHRRKGDCSDIETLILPGGDTRSAIADAVNAIKPKGKTPLSAAVIAAAEALKYTEERATVILVSDGRETCELDPCKVGRDLEEAGIDFTAHVIGFDISDPKDRAELQCLAEETGGSFRTASNASELSEALQVVAEPEPEPEPVYTAFRATEGENGPVILDQLVWELFSEDGTALAQTTSSAKEMGLPLPAGNYRIEVLRVKDESSAEKSFRVADQEMTITLVLPKLLPVASLSAQESAVAGATIDIGWVADAGQNDYVSVAVIGAPASHSVGYNYTRTGNPVAVKMPLEAGTYELRYHQGNDRTILAHRNITITPVTATLEADDVTPAGGKLAVNWQGPGYQNDYISIAKIGTAANFKLAYSFTRKGSPLSLQVPTDAGDYEIRYVAEGTDRKILARRALRVEVVTASLDASLITPAGGKLLVNWTGPGDERDYISLAKSGDGPRQYETYEFARHGSPLRLQMPAEPGEYELRYVAAGTKHKVLASRVVTVEAVTASLEAAPTTPAGGKLLINWTGPGDERDYISIAKPGVDPRQYETYEFARNGSPLRLQMPTEPGEYELRYVAAGTKHKILTTRKVVLETVSASIEAVSSTPAGGDLVINWTGPGDERDYISIAKSGDGPRQYETYEFTRNGSPLRLKLPTNPGEYELRYVAAGTKHKVLTTRAITISAATATLEAGADVPAGSTLVVTWQGPGHERDYISVAKPDAKANQYEFYTNTRDGSPLRLQIPGEPGEYELRYVVTGADSAVIERLPVTVLPATASLVASDTATPGSELTVTWDGPGYESDYIAISLIGEKGYKTYTYTRDGSPLVVKVPERAGDYELRYVLGKSRHVVVRKTLRVE